MRICPERGTHQPAFVPAGGGATQYVFAPRVRSPLHQAQADSEAQAFQAPEGSFLVFFLVDGGIFGRDGQLACQSVGHGDDFYEEEVQA